MAPGSVIEWWAGTPVLGRQPFGDLARRNKGLGRIVPSQTGHDVERPEWGTNPTVLDRKSSPYPV